MLCCRPSWHRWVHLISAAQLLADGVMGSTLQPADGPTSTLWVPPQLTEETPLSMLWSSSRRGGRVDRRTRYLCRHTQQAFSKPGKLRAQQAGGVGWEWGGKRTEGSSVIAQLCLDGLHCEWNGPGCSFRLLSPRAAGENKFAQFWTELNVWHLKHKPTGLFLHIFFHFCWNNCPKRRWLDAICNKHTSLIETYCGF